MIVVVIVVVVGAVGGMSGMIDTVVVRRNVGEQDDVSIQCVVYHVAGEGGGGARRLGGTIVLHCTIAIAIATRLLSLCK